LDDLFSGERRRLVGWAVVRTITAVALVVAIYFLVPLDHGMDAGSVTELVLGLLAFVAIIAWQLRQIVRSGHPSIRAVEALAFSVPLYIFVFATAYFLMAHANAASFGSPMTRTDSMYFSTTVFTTVGFGDITAKSQAARVVVTMQMFLDLVILGLVARLIVNAVKMGKQRNVA
jgi:hypothetical protein